MFDFLWAVAGADGAANAPHAPPAVGAGFSDVGAADAAAEALHAPAAWAGAVEGHGAGGDRVAAARRAREAVGRQRAEDAVRQMDKLANPTLQEHVSKMFSFGGKESSKTMCALSFGRDGEAVGVDRRRQQGRFRHRALASHVAGVRKGLLVHCRNCDVLVCSEVADDATMWTRLPEDGTGDAARAQRASRKRLKSRPAAAAVR